MSSKTRRRHKRRHYGLFTDLPVPDEYSPSELGDLMMEKNEGNVTYISHHRYERVLHVCSLKRLRWLP